MAITYTATGSGLWSEGSTWQSASGQFPSASGDVATININQTVTYDITSSVEFGNVNVNGLLIFTGSKNTLMTFGNAVLSIGSAGELRIGTSSAVLTGSVSASIMFNRTADNTSISIAAGGKLTIYGDPAYYGNNYETTIAEPYTASNLSSSTVVVTGDFTSSWQVGQELVLHKGTTYSNYLTDVCTGSIVSLAASGSNTAISMSGVTGSYFPGGVVLNCSRNVILSKLNANKAIGQYQTNRPRISDNNTADGTVFVNIYDASMVGWDRAIYGGSSPWSVSNTVIRNGNYAAYQLSNESIVDAIILSNAYGFRGTDSCIISGSIVAQQYGFLLSSNCDIQASIFGNQTAFGQNYKHRIYGVSYGNSVNIASATGCIFMPTARICYDKGDRLVVNAYDWVFTNGYNMIDYVRGSKMRIPPVFNNRADMIADYIGVIYCEDYGQVVSASRAFYKFGDVIRNDNVLRTGGATSTLEVVPLSNCNTRHGVPFLEWTEYDVTAGPHIRGIYVSGSGWSAAPDASALYLEAEYYNSGSGPTKTTITSSQQISVTDPSWTKLSVTFTPGQQGLVRYKGWLKAYQSGAEVYVDNQLETS